MPDELFFTEIVQNQTLSVKRHLITFSTQHSDIRNPLSSQVNAIFCIFISNLPWWRLLYFSFTATRRERVRNMNFWRVSTSTLRLVTSSGLSPVLWWNIHWQEPGDSVLLISCCQAASKCCERIKLNRREEIENVEVRHDIGIFYSLSKYSNFLSSSSVRK